MGKLFSEILPEHEAFIQKQRIFFVGSAPLDEEGHVNLSPKGHDVLRILSPTEVAYLDLTGSGNETSAHLDENGRITIMFTAFEGPPMILRLYGKGRGQRRRWTSRLSSGEKQRKHGWTNDPDWAAIF
ncbi:pyridoxamine 5'-phosphate oxidase family protein [Brevibacillus choshinensis]|nr:pyridoxamine 5'-phosphate oxidase family protein [Brevibacillus choshinensis]